MSQQWSALNCIRSSSASSRLFAHSDSLFLHLLWPHVSLVSFWSFEICDFQIESRKFESNRKSNPKALNRIFYCEIESLLAVKSRFKSNRDSDLPTTGSLVTFYRCNDLHLRPMNQSFITHTANKLQLCQDACHSSLWVDAQPHCHLKASFLENSCEYPHIFKLPGTRVPRLYDSCYSIGQSVFSFT